MQINLLIQDKLYKEYKSLVKKTGMKLSYVNENLFIEAVNNYIKENKEKE